MPVDAGSLKRWVKQIHDGQSPGRTQLVEKQSLRVTVWDLMDDPTSQWVRVVYDSKRKTIASVLPRNQTPAQYRGESQQITEVDTGPITKLDIDRVIGKINSERENGPIKLWIHAAQLEDRRQWMRLTAALRSLVASEL